VRHVTKLFALAFLFLPCACASTRAFPVEPKPPQTPLRGGIAEFRLTSYDGSRLRGRVLLGATIDTLVIDGRLVEDGTVEIERARACGTAEVREHYIFDSFDSPRPDQIVTLTKRYWHGSDVYFILWDKETGFGPDCFEADLVVNALDGRIAAMLPIKVMRTDKPPAPPAGAAEAPKAPAPEPGAP